MKLLPLKDEMPDDDSNPNKTAEFFEAELAEDSEYELEQESQLWCDDDVTGEV